MRSVFKDVKWCFNASCGHKGLSWILNTLIKFCRWFYILIYSILLFIGSISLTNGYIICFVEESRGDQCMRCHRPLSAVKPGQQGSPLCGDCQKSPLGKHLSPFSVESLVSPRKEEVEKSSQSHIPTSEPVGTSPMGVSPPQRDVIRHPYYASAMMSAGYFPMHGASTPANMMQYSMQRGMWPPAAPLTSHYRVWRHQNHLTCWWMWSYDRPNI